jgi:transcriptional regulator with GAF, ATPase, and Fis domain
MPEDSLGERLAAAARELQHEADSQHTMETAIKLARDLVPACQQAGISLVHKNNIDTPAYTSDLVVQLDRLQFEAGEGPCRDTIRDQETVDSPDLGQDDRWPRWGPRAASETGLHSMMCFRLFAREDALGALSLYASTPQAFDKTDHDHGLALAAHAALAVAGAREIEHLKIAVDSRTTIGQAQGILMERFEIDAHQAFRVLVRVSMHTNVKLRDVAAELVRTRRTPGT